MYVIYMHRNKINGKVYIGQTGQKPSYRWKVGGKGYETCCLMWKAIQKYGWDNFEHIILKENLSLEEANFYEEYYIKIFNSRDKKFGYNIRQGGNNSVMSESTKQKLSYKLSKENHPFYGKHHSEKSKNQIRETKYLPVLQFDLDGNYIAEYKSAKHAIEFLGFSDKTNNSKCCLGHRKTCYGYIWRYKNFKK